MNLSDFMAGAASEEVPVSKTIGRAVHAIITSSQGQVMESSPINQGTLEEVERRVLATQEKEKISREIEFTLQYIQRVRNTLFLGLFNTKGM